MSIHPFRAFPHLDRIHVFLLGITLAIISTVVVYQILPDVGIDPREYPFEFLETRQEGNKSIMHAGVDFFGDSDRVTVKVALGSDKLAINTLDLHGSVNYNIHGEPKTFLRHGLTYDAIDVDLDGAEEILIDLFHGYSLDGNQKNIVSAEGVTFSYYGLDDRAEPLDEMFKPDSVDGDWLIQHTIIRRSNLIPLQSDSLFFVMEAGTGVLFPQYKICLYRKGDPPVLLHKFEKSIPVKFGEIIRLKSGVERIVFATRNPDQGTTLSPPASSPVPGAVLDTLVDCRGGVFQIDLDGEIQWSRSFGQGGGNGFVFSVNQPADTLIVFHNQDSFLEDGAISGCNMLRLDVLTGTTIDSCFFEGYFAPFIGHHADTSGYIGLIIGYDGITHLLDKSGNVVNRYKAYNNILSYRLRPLLKLPTGELAFAENTRNNLLVVRTLDCKPVSVYEGNGSLFMATYRIGDIEEDRLMISGRDTISEVALIPNGFLLWPVWKFRWPLLFGFLIPSLIIGFYYYLLYRDERKKAWSRLQTEVDNRTRDLHEANTTLNTTKTYLESVFNASEDALITFDSSLAAIRSNHTFMGMFSLSDGDLSSLHTDPELNDKLKVLFPLVQATFSNGNGQSDQYKEFSLGRVLKISSTIMNIPDQPDPQVLLTIRDVSQQFHTKSLGSQSSYPHIIGESELIRKIFNTLDRLKSTETPVLILGESGTGKDLVAQAIHQTSKRRSAPFIAVNCATLVTDLAKSELFGHLKGAFTGATRDHRGYFSQADNGTLFLDEIGDLRPDIQAMLLKVSQTGEYQRMGDEQMRSCDVRIIAATNQPIAEKSGKSGFRRDLFYRFNVVQITMPSLRDRASDIPLLVDHFLTHYSREMEKPTNRVSENSMQILHHYPWPGNIRELSNAIAHAVIFCKGEEIQVRHLPEEISRASLDADSSTNGLHKFSSRARQEWDREYLIAALDHFRWNKRKTAAALDSSPQTLYKYLRKFSIEASR